MSTTTTAYKTSYAIRMKGVLIMHAIVTRGAQNAPSSFLTRDPMGGGAKPPPVVFRK